MTDQSQTEPEGTPAKPDEFPKSRQFFRPNELDKVQVAANLATANGLPISQYPDEFPEDCIIGVLPVTERVDDMSYTPEVGKKRRQVDTVRHVLVWPFATLDQCLNAERAQVEAMCLSAQANAVTRPFRGAQDYSALDLSLIPRELSEIIGEKDRGRYKVYNELCKPFVAIFSKGDDPRYRHVTPPIFRQYCESKALAEAVVPGLEAKGMIVKVINALIKAAESKGMNAQLFHEWLATRDASEVVEVDYDADLDAVAASLV